MKMYTIFLILIGIPGMLWGQVEMTCTDGQVEVIIYSESTVFEAVFIEGADTFTYQQPDIEYIPDYMWKLLLPFVPPIGTYTIIVDGIPYEVFFYGCLEKPDCGEYIKVTGIDSLSFSVNTDTIKELRIDLQAHQIVDTIEMFFGDSSILKLGVGGANLLSGGPVGPFVWKNGILVSYVDSIHKFPYFTDIGVPYKGKTLGLGVFILTIPDTVCDVKVDIWSNNHLGTVWDAFVQCAERVDKVNPRDTLQFVLCEPGLVEGNFISQDTSWFRIRTNETGCTYHEDIMVEVVKRPSIDFVIDEVSCDDRPLELIITHDDDRELEVSVAGQKKSLSHDEIWDMSDLSSIGKNQFLIEVKVEGCVYTSWLEYARWNCNLFFPNAISPNNDGINDAFYPYTGAEGITILELAVYDRWGNWIFNQRDFLPNDPEKGWDGSFRGKDLDAGVYVWWSSVLFPDGTERLFKGDVTLIK